MTRTPITHSAAEWLPTTVKEVEALGWDYLDIILFSGDAYVDHPAFGAAVIGRLLQAEGYRVAIVPQPGATPCAISASWASRGSSSAYRAAAWTPW